MTEIVETLLLFFWFQKKRQQCFLVERTSARVASGHVAVRIYACTYIRIYVHTHIRIYVIICICIHVVPFVLTKLPHIQGLRCFEASGVGVRV